MILVSIWSAKGEGRKVSRGQKVEDDEIKKESMHVHYERTVLTAIQRRDGILRCPHATDNTTYHNLGDCNAQVHEVVKSPRTIFGKKLLIMEVIITVTVIVTLACGV